MTSFQPPSPLQQPSHLTPTAQLLMDVHTAWTELVSASGDIVEIVLATLASARVAQHLNFRPLWMLLVGVPSSVKTEAANSSRRVPFVYFLDSLTENSFISGFVSPKATPRDLLAELNDKVLVIKELTPLFELKPEAVGKILGDLCAIYDGDYSRFTGTRGKVTYPTRFPILACITPKALQSHQRSMNIVGPRFLNFRVAPLSHAEREEGFVASWSAGDRAAQREALQHAVSGLIAHLQTLPIPSFKIRGPQREYLNRLATFLACGRAVVTYAKSGTNYEPDDVQREEPWRALEQLRLLTCTLAFIHGRDFITGHDLQTARRVVFSTIPEDRMAMLGLFQGRRGPITIDDCRQITGKSPRRVTQLLTELTMAGVLEEGPLLNKSKTYEPKGEFDRLLRRSFDVSDHAFEILLSSGPWAAYLIDEEDY